MAEERAEARSRLIVPIAAAVTLMWMVSGVSALYTGQAEVFILASGPFGLMCGYVFGVGVMRKVGTNGNGTGH